MCGREQDFIREAFDSNWIAPLGPNVDGFEREIADFVGMQNGVALISGTAAMHLALKWLSVQSGDVVFCSSLTFAGSCNPIVYTGATPVFIDCEPGTWNMCPDALEAAYEKFPYPKALIVVNLYGQSADYDRILSIAKAHGTPVIEDAAESLGATYKGKPSGSLGDFSILSFNGNKIITTSGGGMLLTNDSAAALKVRFWATQARDPAPWYEHSEIGYNYRLSNICAGIGRGQLFAIKERVSKKKGIYTFYKEALSSIPEIEWMPIADFGEPNYWLSCLTLSPDSKVSPGKIIEMLAAENIESRPIWKPMHLQPVYAGAPFFTCAPKRLGSFSGDIFKRGVCLPSDTKLTEKDLSVVADLVRSCFK